MDTYWGSGGIEARILDVGNRNMTDRYFTIYMLKMRRTFS